METMELLPIGSVVQLEDSTALVMISGYLPIAPSEPNRVWHYSGFRFPLGYTDDEDIYCFDHSQIQVVYAYGYRDIEHDIFTGKLADALKKYAENTPEENGENEDNGEE